MDELTKNIAPENRNRGAGITGSRVITPYLTKEERRELTRFRQSKRKQGLMLTDGATLLLAAMEHIRAQMAAQQEAGS